MSFYVYCIQSAVRNYLYVGLTCNVSERISRHNNGYERTTKPYRPFRLIYQVEFATRAEARKHEKFLKSTGGKRFLRAMIEDLPE